MEFLAERKQLGDEFAGDWTEMEELYVKKLWHQLTLKVLAFVYKPEITGNPKHKLLLTQMYEQFIHDFEHRINQLQLVEICLPVARAYKEPAQAISFLDNIKEKVKHEDIPRLLCATATGAIYLEQKQLLEAKRVVEETDAELTRIDGVTVVHGRYYELSSNYYKTIGNHSLYYKNALRYLGCIKVSELSAQTQQEHALFLSLAALLGEGIYNFGELLQHPVLQTLRGTRDQWLVDLLFAFNRGDLMQFDALRPSWEQQADLKAAEVKMRQKICLLCLMEMSFNQGGNVKIEGGSSSSSSGSAKKQLSFADVSAATKLPEEEIELLVMRALSLGLVKGSIDQIDKKIFVSWVQPRVLDLNQIKNMSSRLGVWSTEVNKMIEQVHTNSHEILS